MSDFLTATLILTGVGFIGVAAIGVVRLPDVLCRSHAVAKALTLGIFLMLLGLWVHLGDSNAALKITLAIFFQLVTIPVASHLVGLLALQKHLPRWKQRPMDDNHKPEEK
jgi:multicomponent Na+:H+ antiporter subunit G